MKRYILSIIFAAALFNGLHAQKLTPHRGDVPGAYNFWLYTPDPSPENEEEPKPVVIFLHGASLCGNNLDRVRRYGTIDAIEKGRELDAYVIAPQNPGGSWNPQRVMKIVDWVGENHNIDYDRVYVMGMSLGGYGAIDMAATYPDQIAAAMALCGGGTVKDVSGLNDVPLWIVHGTADRAVSVGQSDKVVNSVKNSGDASRLVYDRVPGMNHSQPARFFYLKDTYDWLFSHSLKDEDRPVNSTFDVSGIKSAYKNLKSTGKKRVSKAKAKGKARKTAARNKRRTRK